MKIENLDHITIKNIKEKIRKFYSEIEKIQNKISKLEEEVKALENPPCLTEEELQKENIPKKIREQEDLGLIEKIKNENCSNSFVQLSSKHQGLCYSVCKKYANTIPDCSGISISDFTQDMNSVVLKSVKKYSISKKAKFSTFLANNMRYHCLNTLRKHKPLYSCEQEELNFLIDVENIQQQKEVSFKGFGSEEVNHVMGILEKLQDKRIFKIFKLRYFSEDKKNRTWGRIGKKINLSGQQVRNLHNQHLNFIKNKLKHIIEHEH